MAWQEVLDAWIGVDADRWRRLNNYFRQNLDEILANIRFFEAGETYTTGGVSMYDVNIFVNALAPASSVQCFQWEALWLPEGLTTVNFIAQALCTVTSPNAFFRVILTEAATGTTYQVDIINLPTAVTWIGGAITVPGNEGFYSLRIDAFNNTGANQSYRAREMVLSA